MTVRLPSMTESFRYIGLLLLLGRRLRQLLTLFLARLLVLAVAAALELVFESLDVVLGASLLAGLVDLGDVVLLFPGLGPAGCGVHFGHSYSRLPSLALGNLVGVPGRDAKHQRPPKRLIARTSASSSSTSSLAC